MYCGVIGQGVNNFPFAYFGNKFLHSKYKKVLKRRVSRLISMGYTVFLSCVSNYPELDFLEAVYSERKDNPNVYLGTVFTNAEQMKAKEGLFFKKREEIKKRCNYVTCLSLNNLRGGTKMRNSFIIDQSDMLLVIWNGKKEGYVWKQINEAQAKGKEIEYIFLNKL